MTSDDALDFVYDYLASRNYTVVPDESEEDDDVLPANDDGDEDAELSATATLTDGAGTEAVAIDDPVRMYLKEIGRVSLLQGEDEVELAKRMDKGKQALRIEANKKVSADVTELTSKSSREKIIKRIETLLAEEKRLADERSIPLAIAALEQMHNDGKEVTPEIFAEKTRYFTQNERERLHNLMESEKIPCENWLSAVRYREDTNEPTSKSLYEIHILMNLLQRFCQTIISSLTYLATGGVGANVRQVYASQCFSTMGSVCTPVPGGMGIADYILYDSLRTLMDKEASLQLELLSRSFSFYLMVLISLIIVIVGYILKKTHYFTLRTTGRW